MNIAASKPTNAVLTAPADRRMERTALPAAAAGARLATSWTILKYTFGLVPIVAGFDKFTNILVNWENYLNPALLRIIPLSGSTLMGIVGVVEIAAGICVFARPRLGGYIVAAWLVCIALSLIASGRFLDVAVRDLVMATGAFTLASLTSFVNRERALESPR